MNQDTFDFIVTGAGSAGCAVAARLSKAFHTVMRPTIWATAELIATRGGTIVAGSAWNHRPEATRAVPNPASPVTKPPTTAPTTTIVSVEASSDVPSMTRG